MIIAKQSTATTFTVGPVLDASGVAVTDCVIGDFTLSKNGGAPAAFNGSATLTHRAVGFYSLAATATDLNTVGTAETVINDTTNACPMKEIQVVEEAVYDAFFAASALGYVANAPVNAAQVGGQTASAAAPVTFPATIASTTNITSASGVSLSGTQTFNNTGTWTGNLSGNVTGSVNSVTTTVSADVVSISGDGPAADNLERWFDGTVGFGTATSVITGSLTGAVGSVTAAITLPTIPNDWITAAGIETDALTQDAFADDCIADQEVGGVGGNVSGSVLGDLSGRVVGGGATTITGIGAWAAGASGVAVSTLTAAQVNAEVDTALLDVGLTTTVTGRIDAAISTRMATYTQPTGFLAATFPTTVASTTNITAATGVVLSTAGANAVADTTLRRTMANVELSASGDAISTGSIYGLVQMAQNANTVDNNGFITIYRTTDVELGQIPLDTDGTAEPVVAVGVTS